MVEWTLLMSDGSIVKGRGQGAPAGTKLVDLAADAVHARFSSPPGATIYVAGGVDLLWTVQSLATYGPEARRAKLPPTARALGIVARSGARRVFLMPDGSVGIGDTVEAVGAAYRAITIAET